jgi:bud site selection protein 31
MKDAENASHDGKKRYEVLWPIFQISHQRTFRPLRAPPPTCHSADARSHDPNALLLGSRYIYDLYYEKEAISKQLYDWLLKNNYADANLIAKWKKQGYEKVCRIPFLFIPSCLCNTASSPVPITFLDDMLLTRIRPQLCCLRCVQTKETNFNSTCICRVPKAQLKDEQTIQCVSCGCRGCASSD